MYPFCVKGRIIKICPYKVEYSILDNDIEEQFYQLFETQETAERFAKRVNGNIIENDITKYKWLDGIQIPTDAQCPMDAAVEIAEMGQDAYNSKRLSTISNDPMQLRADIDYISIMTGVVL